MLNIKRTIMVILICGLFGLSGCREEPKPIPTTTHSMEWANEHPELIPGAILVPENHDDPDSKNITLSYLILKAKDSASSKYPIIFFAGGPGGNSLDPGVLEYLKDDPLQEQRDMILFDQRGIGYSSGLPDMSMASFDIMAEDADEARELELTEAMISEYQRKCEELNINTEFYNTRQNALDVGMLFEHLGYEKYNLIGGSYGTRIARMVQDLFPEYIHASVLDSPSPMRGDFLIDRLNSYSLALSRIFDYCASNPECQENYPDLESDYYMAIQKLEESPLAINLNDSTTVHINAQDGIYLLRRLLYQSNAREKAPELIKAFKNGEGEIMQQVLQFDYNMSGFINLSMLLSVEKYEQFDLSNTAEQIEKKYKQYPLIPVKLGFFDAFYQAGMNWHQANLAMEERTFQKSDIPSLVFVNQYDPVTPPKNGHLFMEDLSQGQLLILDEGGHGGGNQECKDQVIIAFLNQPDAALDTSCLNIYKEAD